MANWLGALGVSASGLSAERLRMDVVANNIANADTTRTASGGPYRREMVVLQAGSNPQNSFQAALAQASTGAGFSVNQNTGVRVAGIVQDSSPFKMVYDPTNPDAVNGYVQMPNVDIATEMTDLMSASRAYEANVTAFDAGKQMITDALSLGK